MINLSYRYDQNSVSLVLSGMPDVSNGDSDEIIGILSSWSLKIIGSPVLEGKKEHLDNLMDVILEYSRSYISGIRKKLESKENIVTIYPFGFKHKLLLRSTQKNVKPLEIILDDAELSDLTRCLDLLRFDKRIKLNWNLKLDFPFTKKYINNNKDNKINNLDFIYAIIIFTFSSFLLFLIPLNNTFELKDNNIPTSIISK
tara:strand:- start:470 stop:1069 length:600 start_codon:yes stop_codon:yes gene_type:complete